MRQTWGLHGHFNIDKAKANFLKRTRADGDCLIWTGAIGSHKRYGIVGAMGKCWLAHRLSYTLFVGDIPDGECVCHTCDNGFCVKPEHLFVGTQGDNVADMERKGRGRHYAGARHGRAKLTAEQVAAIRHAHANGATIRGLARAYPFVNRTTIRYIVKGKTWTTTSCP